MISFYDSFIVCIYVYLCICMQSAFICVHACMYVSMHVYGTASICKHLYTNTHTYIHTCIHTYIHVYMCILHIYRYVCACVGMHACMYVCLFLPASGVFGLLGFRFVFIHSSIQMHGHTRGRVCVCGCVDGCVGGCIRAYI